MINIRLSLHEKKWDKVKALFDDIINYGHYSLDPDYVGMWALDGAKKSHEVIWAIPCDYDGTSENQWQLMALPSDYTPLGGWATVQSTWAFYDGFESNDVRRTMLIAEYTGLDGTVYNRANPGSNIDLGPIPLKMDPDDIRTTALSTVDIIQYRYTDVILSKAEAIANGASPNEEAMNTGVKMGNTVPT